MFLENQLTTMDERMGDWSSVASPSLTSAFCIMILSYSLRRCRCRRLRLRLCSTTTDGRIVLHQGELWESGHVKERKRRGGRWREHHLEFPPSLLPTDRDKAVAPSELTAILGPPLTHHHLSTIQ